MAEVNASEMLDVHARFIARLRAVDRARPRAREPPVGRGHRGAQARAPRLDAPESRRCWPSRRSTCTRGCSTRTVPEDPYLSAELEAYFPAPLPERYGERMREHRLWREITATQVTNNVAHARGLDVRVPPVRGDRRERGRHRARLFGGPRGFRMREQWGAIESLDKPGGRRRAGADAALRPAACSSAARAGCSATAAGRCDQRHGGLSSGRARPSSTTRSRRLLAEGRRPAARQRAPTTCARPACPRPWQRTSRRLGTMFSAWDIVEVAHETGLEVEPVAAVPLPARRPAASCTWLRDRVVDLSARRPLGRAGPRRAARRPLQPAPRAHLRGAAQPLRRGHGGGARAALDRVELGRRALPGDARRRPARAPVRP